MLLVEMLEIFEGVERSPRLAEHQLGEGETVQRMGHAVGLVQLTRFVDGPVAHPAALVEVAEIDQDPREICRHHHAGVLNAERRIGRLIGRAGRCVAPPRGWRAPRQNDRGRNRLPRSIDGRERSRSGPGAPGPIEKFRRQPAGGRQLVADQRVGPLAAQNRRELRRFAEPVAGTPRALDRFECRLRRVAGTSRSAHGQGRGRSRAPAGTGRSSSGSVDSQGEPLLQPPDGFDNRRPRQRAVPGLQPVASRLLDHARPRHSDRRGVPAGVSTASGKSNPGRLRSRHEARAAWRAASSDRRLHESGHGGTDRWPRGARRAAGRAPPRPVRQAKARFNSASGRWASPDTSS